jgi:hypothetical protein
VVADHIAKVQRLSGKINNLNRSILSYFFGCILEFLEEAGRSISNVTFEHDLGWNDSGIRLKTGPIQTLNTGSGRVK